MSQFKTQQEIYKALLEGKKLKWGNETVELKNGQQVNQSGNTCHYGFAHPPDWSLYTEPKPKAVLYEYMFHYANGNWQTSDRLFESDEIAKDDLDESAKRTGRSFEVECD